MKIKVRGKDLCCMINPAVHCRFCKEIFCIDCGKRGGAAHHFIVNQCRKRFSLEQAKDIIEHCVRYLGCGNCQGKKLRYKCIAYKRFEHGWCDRKKIKC
jgi:hypothetical protein